MVDKAFRATLRNFATLFLLVAVITVPLHLVYSVLFADVIGTRELHSVIETFPESRQVRSVGKAQLTQARIGFGVMTLLELASIAWLARAARTVLHTEDEGGVPSVSEALGSMREGPGVKPDLQRLGPLLVAAAVALAIGLGVERTGLLLLEFVPDERTYPFFGLMQGVSRALGAPFFLVTLALVSTSPRAPREKTPDLY